MRAALEGVLAVALVAAVACGGGAAETPPPEAAAPPPPLEGAALLPEDAFLVAKIDLRRLRASSNWDVLESILMATEEHLSSVNATLGDGGLRRWATEIDRIHLAFAPAAGGGDPDTMGVVEGRYATADARATLAGFQGGSIALREEAGASPPAFVADDPPGRIVLVRDGLGLGATADRVGEMVQKEASREGRGPFEARAELAAVAQQVDFERDGFGLAVVFTPEARAVVGSGRDPRVQAVLDAATAGALRVGLREGVDALAVVRTDDPAVAEAAVAEVERQRAMIARQPMVAMLGLSPIVNGVGANADDGTLRLSLRASHEDTRSILSRASSLVASGLGELLAQ